MEKIATERKRLGKTQGQLAADLGVSRQTVYRWETGKAKPPATALLVLAALFGCSTDYLMGAADERG